MTHSESNPHTSQAASLWSEVCELRALTEWQRQEIARLRAICAMAWEHLDKYGYRSHEDQIKSQDAVFDATRPFVDFRGRL